MNNITTNYTGKEFVGLLKNMSTKQLRKSLKKAYGRIANDGRKIGVLSLRSAGYQVRGNKSDFERSIRAFTYSKGGGFMLTVKPDRANKKSMHTTRAGVKKPVLMWLEDGTVERQTRKQTRRTTRKLRSQHRTGRITGSHFLGKVEDKVAKNTEDKLLPEVEKAVYDVAKKEGLL